MSRMGQIKLIVLGALGLACMAAADRPASEERLSFQSFSAWTDRIHLNADVAMVYGIDAGLPKRIQTWRDRGYIIHVMTGVSWGEYQDYLYGRFDGKNHEDEAQTDRHGKKISHGGDVYYMSPGEAYGRFLCLGVKRAIDAGAIAIHLEEPEFWVRGGYEENFKREWKAYYGDEWRPLHSSVDAEYRASKLKYYLYRRALSQVFKFVQEYSGGKVRCYVPTHSLINYAHWRIVSPESALLDVGCDGYIAQVWTGTARTPNVYQGRLRERTFESAFLEYGSMQNLVRASGRRVWYLNDPVEDNPNHTWEDYRYNWECTLVASLLQPEVWHYEIMPWPDRVFQGRFPSATQPATRIGISPEYETELQAVVTALGDMKQADVRWERCGMQGIGVLVSDTMMFQRGETNGSDAHLGSFYGLAMPLLKHGVPVDPVQIENAASKGFLDRYKVLVLTYEGQKPPTPQFHDALADWVRKGGALVVVDDDKDPYCAVQEWWNTGDNRLATPRQHLFKVLGIAEKAGAATVGKGMVLWQQASPAALTYRPDGASQVRAMVWQAAEAVGVKRTESNALVLRRGPYVVAAGLDESMPNTPAAKLTGRFINLFDPTLPLVNEVEVAPGKRFLLVDVGVAGKAEGVIAAACRVREQKVTPDAVTFKADGIARTKAVVCIALSAKPRSITVDGEDAQSKFAEGVLWLHFENSVKGRAVEIRR